MPPWMEVARYRRPYNNLPATGQSHHADPPAIYDPRIEYQNDDGPRYDAQQLADDTYRLLCYGSLRDDHPRVRYS